MKETIPLPSAFAAMRRSAMRKKSNVEIVEALALRRWKSFDGRTVFVGEVAFFFYLCDTGVAVVGWVAEDDEDRVLLLDLFGVFALAAELFEDYGLGMLFGNPAGESVGEKDSGAVIVGEGSACSLQQRGNLEVGDDEWRGHDLEAEDAGEGDGTEVVRDKRGVVTGIFKQRVMDAMQNGGEIGSGAATGVENADGGTGEAEGLIELGAEKMIDALDHVADDFFGGVPDAKFLAQLGVEGFKEGLVEVGNRFVFAEGFEEGRLNAVEGFSGEVENLLKLDGIQRSGVGYFAKELAEDGNA